MSERELTFFEAQPVVVRQMLLNVARSSVETMRIVRRENAFSWHLPFYLLGSTSLELFAKLVIFTKEINEGKSVSEAEEKLKSYNHHLHKLYSDKGVGKEFLENAKIISVTEEKKGDVYFRYEFFTNSNEPIVVYHPESIRYGLLSEKYANMSFIGYQTDLLMELCEEVERAAFSSPTLVL